MAFPWSENGDQTQIGQLLDEAISRRDFGKLMAAAVAAAAVAPAGAAAARAAAIQESDRGGTIVLARSGDANTLDPHHTILGLALHVLFCIYDTLTVVNPEGQVEGVLAESWDISEDGLEYTFHLRQGINFHDGTPFNADAVKFSFDRALDPATNTPTRSWISAIQETQVVDDHTVKMVLSEPFSPLLGNLATAYLGVPSPTAVEQFGDDFGVNPVGTGAWKFKEWISGETITLVPNEEYHNVRSFVNNKGVPYLDELVFRTIPEAETQLAAFETGEVNAFLSVPPREVTRLQGDSNYEVVVSESGSATSYVEFTMLEIPEGEFGAQWKPPFDDVLLRQAVAYAIDADEMIENVLYGLAVRNYGPMPTGMFAYKPEIEEFGYHYDPEKANALLDQAGWIHSDSDGVREKDGAKLDVLFWASNSSTNERIATIIQNQLNQVGFNVSIELIESATFLAQLSENVSNLNLLGWGQPEPDMLRGMTNGTWGVGRYRDEQYQTLVSDALKTTDPAERTEIYFEAAKKMLADAAMVPLWTQLTVMAVRSEVKDFAQGPFYPSSGVWEDVYVED